jgi:formate/nitrite transporter FocA (FNT family)
MGLLGWMVTSSQETIGRIVVIMLITTVIGIGNMHHCIVGSIEVFSGLLVSSEVRIGDYLHFQGWATLGNAIGGVVFVALVKYSHIKASKT